MKHLILILFSLVFGSLSFAQNKKSQIDEFLNLLNDNQQFMGVVSIHENGQQKYSKAVGVLGQESAPKLNANSKFRIGSISKMFTAVLIFKAIEEAKLSIDTPLSQFYPNIKNADRITISQMLSHRSGIPNFTLTL